MFLREFHRFNAVPCGVLLRRKERAFRVSAWHVELSTAGDIDWRLCPVQHHRGYVLRVGIYTSIWQRPLPSCVFLPRGCQLAAALPRGDVWRNAVTVYRGVQRSVSAWLVLSRG